MAIITTQDLRKLGANELDKRKEELHLELAKEKANIFIGATISSPGRIKEIRKTIARINTVKKQIKEERE